MKKAMLGIIMTSSMIINSVSAYQLPAPAGEHPRLFFTKSELPEIRKRLETKAGKRMLKELEHNVKVLAAKFAKKDEKSQIQLRRDAVNKFSKIPRMVRMTALLYILTQNKEYGKIAKDAFMLWVNSILEKGLKAKDNWGEPEYAMVYDWIYDLLSEKERKKARKIFQNSLNDDVVKMFDKVWWLNGPSASLRNSINWTPICTSGLALTAMATEGEVNCPDAILEKSIKHMRNFLNHGIAIDGAMYEGLTYPTGYGTDRLPYMLMGLKIRGIDLINTTNLKNVSKWFTYEILPWGGEGQSMNKGDGNMNPGTFTTFLASEFDGLADWVYYHASGYEPGIIRTDQVVAFSNGIPEGNKKVPSHLPVSHFFSTNGKVISRSGWQPRDAHFVFCITPLAAGHSHADQGTFCYADDGVNFVADSSTSVYASEEHNIILIDGIGQAQQEAATEAYIRSVDFSSYADIIDADLKIAYDRVLSGHLDGPWHWTQFNPVRKADRRSMFVRGLSGPILIIADDMKKDDKKHKYEWLLHSVKNNKISVEGRRFTIQERFGGKFLESLGDGQTSSLNGKNPEKGEFHGWLLVRGIPYSRWWSNTSVKVNGKKLPYNTTYFQLGQHGLGWHWVPILPKGRGKSPVVELPEGKVTVDLISKTGSQVAMAVFTREFDWQPGFDIPENSEKFIVLKADDVIHDEKPWKELNDPKSELQGVFLGKTAPELIVSESKVTSQPVLKAVQNTTDAKYLCVMAAVSETRPRTLSMPINGNGQSVILSSEKGIDIVAGAIDEKPTTGMVKTDAVNAVVSLTSLNGKLKAYAMNTGKMLSCSDKKLVYFTKGSGSVINDGKTIIVRAPGQSELQCAGFKGEKLLINGTASPFPDAKNGLLHIKVPKASDTWDIKVSSDRKFVEVTGNGPLPLIIPGAPEAIDVKVNGISRWFIKDKTGRLFPSLENGSECFFYKHELGPDKLAAVGTGVKLAEVPKQKIKAVEIGKSASFAIPLPVPALYNLTLQFIPTKAGEISFKMGEIAKTIKIPAEEAGLPSTLEFSGLKQKNNELLMSVKSKNPLWLSKIILNPALELIPAEKWRIIGPFASDWGRTDAGTPAIKHALGTVYSPEEKIDFTKEYIGDLGKKLSWQLCYPAEVVKFDLDKGVTFKQIGVKMEKNQDNRTYTGRICYGVTYIKSPVKRKATLGISCDWWANAYLNGQKVNSKRPEHLKENDGAEFNTGGITEADIILKKGWNTLLIKCHGGTGGNRFVAYITDPGDLELSNKN